MSKKNFAAEQAEITKLEQYNRHDRVFKYCMQNAEIAQDILRYVLPKSLLSIVNLETCRLCENDLLDSDGSLLSCDVLLKLKSLEKNKDCYVLIEQQSKKDKYISFRMEEYANRIVRIVVKNKRVKCPFVFPVLIYTGNSLPYAKIIDSSSVLTIFYDSAVEGRRLPGISCLSARDYIENFTDKSYYAEIFLTAMFAANKSVDLRKFKKFSELASKTNLAKDCKLILARYLLTKTTDDQHAKIKQYILNNEEVQKMCGFTEYLMNSVRNEGRIEGRNEAREEQINLIIKRLFSFKMTSAEIAKIVDRPVEKVEKIAAEQNTQERP